MGILTTCKHTFEYTMRQNKSWFDLTDEDYDEETRPFVRKSKPKKEYFIEARFIGNLSSIFPALRQMYEDKQEWYRYRSYVKFSDAEKALKTMVRRGFEFRLKDKTDDTDG